MHKLLALHNKFWQERKPDSMKIRPTILIHGSREENCKGNSETLSLRTLS